MPRDTTAPGSAFGALDALDLLDWKRRIAELYAQARVDPDVRGAWRRWREVRDTLFREHPQSPLAAGRRASFPGLEYFDYDPSLRVGGEVVDAVARPAQVAVSTGAALRFSTVGAVRFSVGGAPHELELCWNEGYGGGLFLAFRDRTSGESTYGGGRYLLDTVKGSELGFDRGQRELILDFNFAYNPSCSYDPRWACPLAPPANTLPLAVAAGEKHVPAGT